MQSLRAVLTYCSAVIRSDVDMTAANIAVRQSIYVKVYCGKSSYHYQQRENCE